MVNERHNFGISSSEKEENLKTETHSFDLRQVTIVLKSWPFILTA